MLSMKYSVPRGTTFANRNIADFESRNVINILLCNISKLSPNEADRILNPIGRLWKYKVDFMNISYNS